MHQLVKILFGSHLYGTANENSDTDYKGVFINSYRDTLLGNSVDKHSMSKESKGIDGKNLSDAVDHELFSLQRFIDLAKSGDIMAFDMLHAPKDNLIYTTPIWYELVSLREKFYTKNTKPFVDYAGKQAAKYGIKGSRLDAADQVLGWVAGRPDSRLEDIIERAPMGEHVYMGEDGFLHVLGKKFDLRIRADQVIKTMTSFKKKYGANVERARNNEGINWKSVSHALRCCYQVQELYTIGTMRFPLEQAEFVRDVKLGKYPYVDIAPLLEKQIDLTVELAAASDFPEEVDHDFWDDFIVSTLSRHYAGECG
jgi:hypothetical protein